VLSLAATLAGQSSPSEAILTLKLQESEELPIAGATVTLRGDARVFITDGAGEVAIAVLAPARVSAIANADAYYPNEITDVAVRPGEPTSVIVTLQRRSVIAETLVVTATGTEYAVEEAPIRTDLITRAAVERQVKTTLAEAFQAAISGVRMEMNCQNCGFMQIRMNGLEGPYTQILEDGMPSYSGVTAVYGLEQIPASFVDQIEVVKGGSSALYGPGAVAGVVNLIRREPVENRYRIDLMQGWHAGRPERQAGASAQLVNLPFGTSADLFYRGTNRVPVDRDGDGFSDLGKRKLETGGFGLFRRFFADTARLSVNGTVAEEFRRGGDQFDQAPHESFITEQIGSRRYTLAANWTHTVSPQTFYSARVSHAYFRRGTYYGAGMDPNAYGDTRNPLWVADSQVGHQSGRHALLGGYQVQWEHVEDIAPAYGRTYGGTFSNQGVYLQDEWRAGTRFTLLGGVRLDKSNQVERLILSPRAGVKFRFTPNLAWRATVSTGFRAPAVFDEDLHIAQVGGAGFVMQNDAQLREERSVSAVTGVDYAGTLRGRRYLVAANVFMTDLRDAFTLVEDAVPEHAFRRLLRVNGPGANVSGVDIDANLQLTRTLKLRGAFTLQRARWKEPEPQFGASNFFRTPVRFGFVGADWDLPAGIELSGTFDYTGSMQVPHYGGFIAHDRLETTKPFYVFNAVVSRTFDLGERSRVRMFFNLQNIGDTYQPDLDRGPSRDSGYVYGPAEMRRAVFGITCEF
jgi:outer membrane receptor for ferrienterochelin and colicins